jgi:hypothetical protein
MSGVSVTLELVEPLHSGGGCLHIRSDGGLYREEVSGVSPSRSKREEGLYST